MTDSREYALPLFSLIDREKVDLRKPLPESLGDQLALYLQAQFGIQSLSSELLLLGGEAYLVLHGVPQESLAPLFSLADVQKSQLFRYEKTDAQTASLAPLQVKI